MSRLKGLRAQAVHNFKSRNNMGGVLTALDRTMSGLSMKARVEVHEESEYPRVMRHEPFTHDPARFDPAEMTLNLSIRSTDQLMADESLIRLTGFNYHELSHLIYGNPDYLTFQYKSNVLSDVMSRLEKEHNVRSSTSTVDGLLQSLLCLNSEHRMMRQYLGIAPYLMEILIDQVRQATHHFRRSAPTSHTAEAYIAISYALFAGRVYFPRSFRDYMRQYFISVHSKITRDGIVKSAYNSVEAADVVERVMKTAFTMRLRDYDESTLGDALGDLVFDLHVALQPFRTHVMLDNLNVFHPSSSIPSSQEMHTNSYVSEDVRSALKKLRAENNEASEDLPDAEENTDVLPSDSSASDPNGSGGNGEGVGEGESEGEAEGTGEGDGEGDSTGSTSDGETPGGDQSDQESNDGAGNKPGDNLPPIDSALDQMSGVTNYVSSDAEVNREVAARRRAIVNPTGKQILSFADRVRTTDKAVTPDMHLLSKRVSQEFTALTEDRDPGFEKMQSSGRLNVQRAMTGEVELDSLFDRWDEGQIDATEVEVVYLLDRSSSMNGQTDEVSRALWVLKHGIESSNNNSGITVLTYDTEVMIMAGADERESRSSFKMYQASGGTNPLDALTAAEAILSGSRRKNKLMVVLTDGMWFEAEESEKKIEDMRAAGVSTGLMFYSSGWDANRAIESHGCEVTQHVRTLSDVLTFTKAMVRRAMR